MKLIAPERYRDFQCIAGECRHSCCIGWEIDIDPDSLRRFQRVPGRLGERLQQNIDVTEEGACFRLQGEEERCPFLNKDGLCDLILELGEDSLCQICTDHPRFRNFFSDRTEIGLGLCCEAAARLLLAAEEPMRLTVLEDDGEKTAADAFEEQVLHVRAQLFALMQDRSVPAAARAEKLLPAAAIEWGFWASELLQLERLDEQWAEHLALLAHTPVHPLSPALEIPLEQLMCCLLYRHLPGAVEDGDLAGRIRFCGLLWQLTARLCRHLQIHDAFGLAELARLISSEIEYSEENTCAILDLLAETMA